MNDTCWIELWPEFREDLRKKYYGTSGKKPSSGLRTSLNAFAKKQDVESDVYRNYHAIESLPSIDNIYKLLHEGGKSPFGVYCNDTDRSFLDLVSYYTYGMSWELALDTFGYKERDLVSSRIDSQKEILKRIETDIAIIKSTLPNIDNEFAQRFDKLNEDYKTLIKDLGEKDRLINKQQQSIITQEKELLQPHNSLLSQKVIEALNTKNYDEVDFLLESALRETNDKTEVYFQMGIIKESKLQLSEALSYFELAANNPTSTFRHIFKAGSFAVEIGVYDKGFRYLFELLNQENLDPIISAKVPSLLIKIGYGYNLMGYARKAIAPLEKAESLLINSSDIFLKTDLYNTLAMVYLNTQDFSKSKKCLDSVLLINKDEHTLGVALAYTNLGSWYTAQRQFTEASSFLVQALDIHDKVTSSTTVIKANMFEVMGSVRINLHCLDEGLDLYEGALNIYSGIYGDKCAHVQHACLNVGLAYLHLKNYSMAIEYFARAIEIGEYLNNTDTFEHAHALMNLSIAYFHISLIDEAIEICSKAIDLFKNMGILHFEVFSLTNLGSYLFTKNERKLAISKWLQAYEIRIKHLQNEILPLALNCELLFGAYLEEGDFHSALSYCKKAIIFYELEFGPNIEKIKMLRTCIRELKIKFRV